jgi:LPS-assembly lipoprotein
MSSFSLLRVLRCKIGLVLTLLIGLALTSGCGFQPLHGTATSVDSSLGSTRVSIIAERNGQILHNHLRDRLNPDGLAPNPLYGLSVGLKIVTRTTGFTSDQSATYATIVASADYVLTRHTDSLEVYKGTAEAVTSYNKFVTPYTNRYSEKDATERALASLGDDIYNSLSAYFATTN